MPINQKGFIPITIIVIILLLPFLLISLFVIWDVFLVPAGQKNLAERVLNYSDAPPNCSRKFTPQFNSDPYYQGTLFDSHFHIPPTVVDFEPNVQVPELGKDVSLTEILCFFDKENVKGAVGFYTPGIFPFLPLPLLDTKLDDAQKLQKYSFDRFKLFLIPAMLSAEKVDKVITDNPGVFVGLGEIVFYSNNDKPDDKKYMDLYKIAAKHKLVVMFHPGPNQQSNTENVIKSNPDVVFLLHGHELSENTEFLVNLLERYPTIYYSIDSATLYHMKGKFVVGPKEEFVSQFKKEFQTSVDDQVKIWKPLIEKYPDRFMWGTDRFTSWHFNDEISSLFEEYARAFIARLNPDLQEKFAYKNAEKLFK